MSSIPTPGTKQDSQHAPAEVASTPTGVEFAHMGDIDRAPRKIQRIWAWAWAGMMVLAALAAIGHAILG